MLSPYFGRRGRGVPETEPSPLASFLPPQFEILPELFNHVNVRFRPEAAIRIYARTGIAFDLPSMASDLDAQALVASLITLVAKSDGGISPDEIVRMVEMLRQRFPLEPAEALSLITRTAEELSTDSHLDEILREVNDTLALPHKEELMLMVLNVIAADNQKDAEEMKLLGALIDGLKIPNKIMQDVYARYFEEKRGRG